MSEQENASEEIVQLPDEEVADLYDNTGPLILVTGASGYIATHIVQQLQQEGYRVRGTVRSLRNESKTKPLRQLCPEAKYQLEVVEADLNVEASWLPAIKGCTYVIHTASPFPKENPKHEDEVIRPAVDGTLSVLKACHEAGSVKRVVLTSSIASIIAGNDHGNDYVYSESDWTNVVGKNVLPYYKSKTLAEKAAWDYVESLSGEQRFELAVVNPGYVLGPVLCGSFATSMEIPKRLLQHEMPMLPKLNFPVVDVRDVAKAHIKAMTVLEAAGNRHILSTCNMWVKDMALILKEEFGSQGYHVPTHNAPSPLLKVSSLFDKSIKMILPSIGEIKLMDNTRMKTTLEIQAMPVHNTFVDMCYSMIENGMIKKAKKYKAQSK